MAEKLKVLVRLDLDGSLAQVIAQGHITAESLQGLYPVMKRTKSMSSAARLEIDLTRAHIEPDALNQLRACSESHHLPADVDPLQSNYTLRLVLPQSSGQAASRLTRAA
ncbi:hypothetical protein ACIP9X_03230 [Arthrobacter sp. NPDC093125]|uniref:hypothetical protein n=1 Tax=Arthrobacter sp. NPDC093125 TaxID=3363944 RepID=UPI0037FE5D01